MSRQAKRREAFIAAFRSMPLWETWTETVIKNGEPKERGNCRGISRRVRRDMARQLSKRRIATATNSTRKLEQGR